MAQDQGNAVDILVRCENPAALDRTVQQLGPAAVHNDGEGNYILHEGCYVVRCFGNAGYIEFAMKEQGYATVVRRLEAIP